jgi:hypothetical protein
MLSFIPQQIPPPAYFSKKPARKIILNGVKPSSILLIASPLPSRIHPAQSRSVSETTTQMETIWVRQPLQRCPKFFHNDIIDKETKKDLHDGFLRV